MGSYICRSSLGSWIKGGGRGGGRGEGVVVGDSMWTWLFMDDGGGGGGGDGEWLASLIDSLPGQESCTSPPGRELERLLLGTAGSLLAESRGWRLCCTTSCVLWGGGGGGGGECASCTVWGGV